MSSFSVDGLVSGINTSGMIDAMMAVERLPQMGLQDKIEAARKTINAYQTVNGKTSSLAKAAEKLVESDAWGALKGTSSSEHASVSVKDGAAQTSLSFDVKKVAQAEVRSYDLGTFDADAAESAVEYKAGPPPVINVSGTNANPQAVAQAINAADGDYSASVVNTSDGARLIVTSNKPGLNQFTMKINMPNDTTEVAGAVLTAGQDAEISIGSGAAALTVTSSSNTFTDLVQGVDVTVSGVADGVTVGVESSTSEITSQVKSMMDALGGALGEASAAIYAAPAGKPGTGALVGNSMVRSLKMELQSAGSGYAAGGAAYEVGIEIQRDGKFTFDQSKLTDLIAEDPEKAQSIVTDIATRLNAVAERFSDPQQGTISSAIESKQGQIRSMDDQVAVWDRRLALRETNLKRQFSAMESLLSGIQGQGNWLAGQLGGASNSQQ